MDFIYSVIGFRHTAIVSVIVSVERDKSLFRSLFRFFSTFKIRKSMLSKSLFRWANKRYFFLTETMTNFKVCYSPCSEI
jgi:hypothetical protein